MNGVITFVKEKNIAKISEENEKNGMHIIKKQVVNEPIEGTGIKILSPRRMLQRLFLLFKQYN